MKLVSENSPTDLDRRRLRASATRSLSVTAANILRICAGAGKPEMLGSQMRRLYEHFEALGALGEALTPDEIKSELNFIEQHFRMRPWLARDEYHPETDAEQTMKKGALRAVAGALEGNPSQESQGESLLMRGFVALRAHFEECNRTRR